MRINAATMSLEEYKNFEELQEKENYKKIAYIEYEDKIDKLEKSLKVCDIDDIEIIETTTKNPKTNEIINAVGLFNKKENDKGKRIFPMGNVTFLDDELKPVKNTPGHHGFDITSFENILVVEGENKEVSLNISQIESIDISL